MKKSAAISLLLATSLFGFENTVGSHGYGRIQVSFDDAKNDLCFQAPGAGSKYRLGNECETWLELALYDDLKFDSGVVLHTQVRPLFVGGNGERVEFFGWGEVYGELSGLFENGAKVWAGRKNYDRYDSQINDYFYFNNSGDGAGISDIPFGGGLFSYAFFYDELSPSTTNEHIYLMRHDLRWRKKFGDDELTLVLDYSSMDGEHLSLGDIETTSGFALGAIYKLGGLTLDDYKGESISGLFYGEGLSKNAFANVPNVPFTLEREKLVDNLIGSGDAIESSKTWRILSNAAVENDDFGFMGNFVYESKDDEDFGVVNQEWLSLGVRGYWFAYKNVRLVGEVGYDSVDDKIADETYELVKSTAAVELALDKGIWNRPVLRLYYTNASWNDEAKGKIGGTAYADKTSADNVGVQLEYWW